MFRKILTIIVLLAVPLQLPSIVRAQDESASQIFLSRSEWAADENIVRGEEMYSWPKKIYIVPIKKANFTRGQQDIRELFYFFATRSQIGDIPFHYVVSEEGAIYQGHRFGDEASISVEGTQEAIIIGYLYNGDEHLSIGSIPALKDILLQVMNTFAIKPGNAAVRSMEFTFGANARVETIALKKSSSSWQKQFADIFAHTEDNYAPQQISYDIEVINVSVPEQAQEPTGTADITLKIKNTGKTNIYASATNALTLARSDPFDERSLFYNEASWDSPSRVALLSEGERFAVDEEKEVTLSMYVPLYPPERTEKFIVVAPDGEVIEDSEFNITIKINSTDEQIIEVTDTPVGYLNVRQTPGLGEVVTKVAPGERFIVLDYQTGYYKIEANGKEGWVVNTYVRVVQ